MYTTKCSGRFAGTVLLFFCFLISFSQKNYLSGFIISSDNDTVYGYVDYRNWESNPGIVFFKKTLEDDKQGYSPVDIKEFGVLDEKYMSAVIETELSSDKTNDLSYDAELNIVKDTGFLQTLVKGEKSLYLYRSKLGKEQYYIGRDSSYDLLVYKKYLKDQEGKSVIVENRRYIGQLILYLKDCSTIQQKLQNTTYQQNSLEKLFLSYYDCTHSEFEFHKKTEKVNLEFGVLAGMSLTSLKFKSASYVYLSSAKYQPSIDYSTGFFLDIILPRNNGRWSIYNELLLSSYEVSGQYEIYEHASNYTIVQTSFGYCYLKMNNMVRIKFPVRKTFLYFNAGISSGIALVEKNYTKVESVLFTQNRITEGKALDKTRKFEIGVLGGIGVRVKRFSCEMRYEYASGMSDYNALVSSTNRLYLLLGFRF